VSLPIKASLALGDSSSYLPLDELHPDISQSEPVSGLLLLLAERTYMPWTYIPCVPLNMQAWGKSDSQWRSPTRVHAVLAGRGEMRRLVFARTTSLEAVLLIDRKERPHVFTYPPLAFFLLTLESTKQCCFVSEPAHNFQRLQYMHCVSFY
jgi:hypothetical protein